jgi:predicted P-loop ATPase
LKHSFDPVCDYLDGLQWDGAERLDRWMVDYLGAADTPLIRAFGRLSLIAAVRRARQPGAKFDQIIVFEGKEGKGKSTAIETLAGKENFSDQHILGVDDKTQQELLKGVWLYEIADLSGIRKADVDKVKAFASRREDRSRPAFGHFLLNQPRRCVIFATTNNEEYLQADENRRFWPVRVGEIHIEKLKADRDQLWAEAAQKEATGISIMLPEALWPAARAEQALRREHDQWDDLLGDVRGSVVPALNGDGTEYEERISAADLLTNKLKVPADRINAATGKRLKATMRRLGWDYRASLRIGPSKNGGYSRPCEAPAPAPDGQPGVLPPPNF